MRERRGQPPRHDGNEEAVGEWREKLATERSAVKGSSSSQRVRDGQHVTSMQEKKGDGRKKKIGTFWSINFIK